MSSLVDALISERVLVCPACGAADWGTAGSVLECRGCGAQWPVRNAVPDFFNRYRAGGEIAATAPASEIEHLVATIVEALDLPAGPETFARVGDIVQRASAWACESDALTAEINVLLDRFAAGPRDPRMAAPPADANRDPQVRFERHYLPDALPARDRSSANVRVTNVGAHPWSSRVPGGLVLRGRWVGDGPGPAAQDAVSRLPVDIYPGRSISIPLRLQAPRKAGLYRLRVELARDNTDESFGPALEWPVRVGPPRPGLLARLRLRRDPAQDDAETVEHGPEIPDYGEDHAAGVRLIEAVLKGRASPGARLLEVGSGTHPHLAWLTDYQLVALDISSPLLELGSLYFRDRFRTRLALMCADAFNPPLAPGSFELVAMFSALHHFPEPEAVLARLARLLKPGGLLAVMCEPVGESLEQPDTIRDLLNGINEQVFSVDEYRRIFGRAGLRAQRIRVDGGSLKAILAR